MAKRVKAAAPVLADAALLALGPPQSLAAFGLLLSGEVLGLPTDLPWAIYLLGASRHPTQLYYAIAAALTWLILRSLARRYPIPGVPTAAALALQGLAWLIIEPFRADAPMLPGGVHLNQILGLALILIAMWWQRSRKSKAIN
jgi:phosphatidylglycerol:prolipoprotein diacylglycerol transferase